ncbi:MAG: NCS2 family permease [Candidatus Acidiferrales bacterium]
MIERLFRLAEHETTVRRELLGGLTTFMTMAYIIVVNPQILAHTGMPERGVLFATCVSTAVATAVMGLYANYPIALAPGMSLNAYFTYSVCLDMHIPWQTALGVVFISGALFFILTVTRVREQVVNGIPEGLKHSTAAGIGLFIAFVGLHNAKLVTASPETLVTIGNFGDRQLQLACFGLVVTAILMARRVNGAILIGIAATTLLGVACGATHLPSAIVAMPDPSGTWMKLDLRRAAHLGLIEIIFAFLFVDLFDNVGTLVGVCEQAGIVRDGKIPRVGRALLADAAGTMLGAVTGTSTVTSYIESAAGVAAGARTGLSSVFVSVLFLGAMFFSPLAAAIPEYATAPALILIGALIAQSIGKVGWDDFTEAFPGFITMIAMPLTFSIATGLSFGLISYTLLKLATGRAREINAFVWIVTAVFLARYVYLARG